MGAKKTNMQLDEGVYVKIDPCFKDTGEIKIIGSPINVSEIATSVPRGGFEIAYMMAFYEIFEKLGTKKIKVLKYLLSHKDGSNCINTSHAEICEAVKCSRPVVSETLKTLEDMGLISRKGSVIRISPKVCVKGDASREAYILRKFYEEQQ